ncbi:MAG: hypothetical protein ACC631_02750, partial [Halocynthiibacter sp.]
ARELGYDAELDLFRGLSVPKGTSDVLKEQLANAMAKAAQSDAFMSLAEKKGFTVAPTGYKAFAAFLASEDAKVKAIFQGAGLYKTN